MRLVVMTAVLFVAGCTNCPRCPEPTSRAALCDEAAATAGDEEVAPAPRVRRVGPAIRLCSWNVKKLGHGTATDFPAVARVFEDQCDVSVIVEVMQRAGGHPGYDTLMETLGDDWSGVVTDSQRPRTGAGHAEFYAVIWRVSSGVAVCDDWADGLVYHHDNDGGANGTGDDLFAREPAYVCLQHTVWDTGRRSFDLLIAAYHATWAEGDTETIAAEVANVEAVVEAMRAARVGERDLLVMGDFNLVPEDLAGVAAAADRTTGSGSTLNSRGAITRNLYDHLLVADEDATGEIRGNARVLDVRGVAASERDFYRTVSDHLPIQVLLSSVSGNDDD